MQTGECYLVDPSAFADFPRGNKARLLADSDVPKPDVAIHNDGTIYFITNCESSMYQASTAAVWNLQPEYKKDCGNITATSIPTVALFR
jgi:hypothetical protein